MSIGVLEMIIQGKIREAAVISSPQRGQCHGGSGYALYGKSYYWSIRGEVNIGVLSTLAESGYLRGCQGHP